MKYIIKENQYKLLIQESEIPENKMTEFQDIAKKEFEQNQKKIAELENTINIYKTTIDKFADDTLSRDSGLPKDLIEKFKKDIEDKLEYEIHALNYLKTQTYEIILNSLIKGFKYQETQRIERQERLKNKEITKENLIDLFVTALEGGSNYWYYILNVPSQVKEIMETQGLFFSEAVGEYVLNGGEIEIRDAESIDYSDENEFPDTGEVLGYVNMDSLLDAINKIKEEYPEVYENILEEEYDANDADIFFQIATMGEVIFG